MLIPALLLFLAPAGEVHVDDVHGFRIEVPEGWTTSEQDAGSKGFVLSLLPPGGIGHEGVSVTVVELSEGQDTATFVEKTRERAESGEEFSDYEEWEGEFAGRKTPGIRVSYAAPSGAYRIVQSFVVEGGSGFTIQRHAKVDDFEARADEFEEIVRTFGLVEISEEGASERRLTELAERCGSEVDWAETWEEAAERAREENRLVLVVAFLLPGFSISDTPRTTTFVDEDVVALVNERFVPFWYTAGVDAPFVESYGLSRTAFGQALLLVTPGGDVLLESREASNTDYAYPFLRAGLARHPGFTGAPVPEDLAAVDLAQRRVARGELERALELLADEPSGRAHRLRARALRLTRKGAEALAALAAARATGGEPEAALLVEEAELLVREGRDGDAIRLLDSVLEDHAGSEDAAKAQLVRGLLDLRARDRESAKARWRALTEEHPDSRWAWQAAAALRSTFLDLDVRPDLRWPDEALLAEQLTAPESAPLPPDRAREAEEGALAWLLAAQRENGSWRSSTETSRVEDTGADPFADAISAWAGRALLRHPDVDEARDAARRALDYLVASVASRIQEPPLVAFMDYMTWSDSIMIHFLADALAAGLAEADAITPTAEALAQDLAARQVKDGGWSYYVTSNLGGSGAPAQSISFTTAAAVLALARAREVGFDVPDEVFETAVSALERMRDDEGVFAYFLYAGSNQAVRSTAAPGAVGRGPACELALFRAGKSDDERLSRALELLLDHAPLYSAEQGKVLMHAGPDGQGCHYLFFDYAHAAFAHAAARGTPKARVQILELVLDCRQPDNSFLDTPILGRAYGTAMALLALDALESGRER